MIKIRDHHLPYTRDVAGPSANKIELSKFDYAFTVTMTTCSFEGDVIDLDLDFNFKLGSLRF